MEAIGIRSPLFDTRLLAEEVIQLSSQTVAAYTASQSITNVKLNTVYAIVLFINSTSTFVFRHVFKTSLLRQRLASVMTNLLLNFVWGSLLPIWMYVPLVQIYLNRADEIGSLKSFTNSSREVERVLVVAWVNYVMSILPFCLSLFSLLEVNDILYELSSSTFDTKHEQPQGANLVKPQYSVGRMDHGLIFRSVRRSIPLLGLTVLFISAAAHGIFKPIQGSNNTLCMNRVYPWFSSKEACVGRQIDCAVLGIYGSKTELEDVFGGFDRQSLCDLYLYNCSKLEIPSAISKFRQLMLIVIGGGHLYEWGDSANISFQSFPNLHAIQMYNVTIGKDPIGLTGREPISPIVEWIHLEHVDGSRILSLVGINWPNIQTLDCIHCGLSEVPSVFENIPTLTVAVLAHNNISVIRDDWLASTDAQLQMLWLTGNMMLTELPNAVWRQAATAGLFELSLTNLSTVPRWVRDEAAPDFVLTAGGTPVCSTRNQTLLPSQVICSGVSYLGYDA